MAESTAGHAEGPEGVDPVIDAAWIRSRLGDARVRLIELDVSPAAYDAGHIPGAVFWNAYSDLRGPDYQPVEHSELERLLSRSGIAPETTVVFYGYGAALGFWLMKAHGHRDVRMLVGSREQWAESAGEWTTEVPEPAESSYPLPPADTGAFADRPAVERALGEGDHVLLDVRSELEFAGEHFWPSGATEDSGRTGHLPGARSVPIDLLRAEDDTFRSAEEMRDALSSAGITPEQQVITYCTIGNRASQAWFALSYLLDYPNVTVYYPSWVEWGRSPDTPIER
jgi:thiosulfate/3-mercaptopyruvate sulfurtransferase